jgi:hypothetical protein
MQAHADVARGLATQDALALLGKIDRNYRGKLKRDKSQPSLAPLLHVTELRADLHAPRVAN